MFSRYYLHKMSIHFNSRKKLNNIMITKFIVVVKYYKKYIYCEIMHYLNLTK